MALLIRQQGVYWLASRSSGPPRRWCSGSVEIGTAQYNQMVMGIYDTYSKRLKRREQAGQVDIYQYDDIPERLRVQIIHIWNSAIGPSAQRNIYTGSQKVWKFIRRHPLPGIWGFLFGW